MNELVFILLLVLISMTAGLALIYVMIEANKTINRVIQRPYKDEHETAYNGGTDDE